VDGCPTGEIAALGTALCWSVGPLFFTTAAKSIGALDTNRLRLLVTSVLYLLGHLLVFGALFPAGLDRVSASMLVISGVLGMAVGDTALYQSMLFIGPRRSMLVTTTTPVFSTVLAWVFLSQILGLWQVAGILLTVSGIGWVILRQPGAADGGPTRERLVKGVSFALLAALTQSASLIVARRAMGETVNPFSASLVRFIGAAAVMWLYTVARGEVRKVVKSLFDKRIAALIGGGCVIGPFVGVTLSMVAIRFAPIGIATALMVTTPLMVIPFSRVFFDDHPGLRGVAGALLAVAGVALIFMARSL
jgi:drug/metabolite transporter (DMT)-like permease